MLSCLLDKPAGIPETVLYAVLVSCAEHQLLRLQLEVPFEREL